VKQKKNSNKIPWVHFKKIKGVVGSTLSNDDLYEASILDRGQRAGVSMSYSLKSAYAIGLVSVVPVTPEDKIKNGDLFKLVEAEPGKEHIWIQCYAQIKPRPNQYSGFNERFSIVYDVKRRRYAHVKVKRGKNWEKITVCSRFDTNRSRLNLNDLVLIKEAVAVMFAGPIKK
jgi:hypothetical protein